MAGQEYKFEPAKRKSGFKYPLLSMKDEFVPSTHIGIYDILRNPNNKKTYVSEEHCQKLRYETFDNIMKIYTRYGSPKIDDLFNNNIGAFNQLNLNRFAHIKGLIPFAGCIECLSSMQSESRYGVQKREIICFGIRKDIIDNYVKTKRVPVFAKTVNPYERDLILFGAEEIALSQNKKVEVTRTAKYRQFVHWCELQGVDKEDGLIMAFESLFERYPITELLPTSAYDVITDFDRPMLFKKPTLSNRGEKVNKQVEFSKFVYDYAEDILARYNRDVDNTLRQMDMNAYINNAVNLLNNSMDLKYRDPELAKEVDETQDFIKDSE